MAKKRSTNSGVPPARSAAKGAAPDRAPEGYADLLADVKGRIRSAQVRAALAVNRELVSLYWEIGRAVVQRQQAEGWGRAVIDRLAKDLQAAFPGVGGFSPSNLWRMRAFYLAYAADARNLAQAVRDLGDSGPPAAVAEIPWGHNILLVEKLDDPAARLWYARMTIEQGWSRSILGMQIEAGAHRRHGKALTNFAATLPEPQSDLARDLLKDPYNFDFLTLAADARERHLQSGLLEHLREFLLELGVGFAFVGSRYPLEVGGKDYFLDLLFYHLKLRAFVVIELKVTEFEPEHLGKMNFYLSAVDDLLRHPEDRPSVGLILCPAKNSVVVEYALRDTAKPIGVAGYTAGKALPADVRDQLPSPERLEEELRKRRPRPKRTDERRAKE